MPTKFSITVSILLVICQSLAVTAVTGLFQSKIFNSTWPPSGAVIKPDAMDCATSCLDKKCFAFHLTQKGRCYFMKSNRIFAEQKSITPRKFWLREDATPPQCNASLFPYSFGKSRYFVEKTEKKNWMDAARHCQSVDGKLVQISSDPERLFVANMSFHAPGRASVLSVGLYRDRSYGVGWKWWASYESLSNREFWGAGEPRFKRHAAGFKFDKDPNHFYTIRGDVPFGFVCECLVLSFSDSGD